MNILVINCGSSSLKYQLINSDTEAVLAKGLCERIGIEGSQITYQPAGGEKEVTVSPMPTHTQAIQMVLDALTNKKSGVIEEKLHKSTKNRELIELLELEKSLVYFTTSLRSNEVVLEKLMRNEKIKKYPEDTDLLEDVIIENKQAIEMANIYSGVLANMTDAFASIVSNNLNNVMRIFTIISITLSIPTLIFSMYGMNFVPGQLGMPFTGKTWGFTLIIVISVVLSAVVAWFLTRSRMFK